MKWLKLFRNNEPVFPAVCAGMSESEISKAIHALAEKLIRYTHDHAIKFYRAIGSHDFGGYPGVWEEFVSLVMFVSEQKLKKTLSGETSDKAIKLLREQIDSFLYKNDKNFDSNAFWDFCDRRLSLYSSRLAPGDKMDAYDRIISAFCSNVLSRLNDWPALVSHHAAAAAAETINGLLE